MAISRIFFHDRTAAILAPAITLLSFALINAGIFLYDGLASPFFPWLVLTPVCAMTLSGSRAFIMWSLLTIAAAVAWLAFPLANGHRPAQAGTGLNFFAFGALFLFQLILVRHMLRRRENLRAIRTGLEDQMRLRRRRVRTLRAGQAAERRRLAGKLDCEIGPQLERIRELNDRLARETGLSGADRAAIGKTMEIIAAELGRIASDLDRPLPGEDRLEQALGRLCRELEADVPVVHAHYPGAGSIPLNAAALHLCRIVQEAFRNIRRHAGARHVWIFLAWSGESRLCLRIVDDGAGIQTAESGGQGLRNMRDRTAILNGSLHVTDRPGGGTVIECFIPATALDVQGEAP